MPVRVISVGGTSYWAPIMQDPVRRSAVALLEDISRAGASGHSFRELSARGEPYAIVFVFTCTEARRAALRIALEKLQGTIISYVTHFGETFTHIACVSSRCVDEAQALKQ